MMVRWSLISVSLIAIGIALNPIVPFWLIASAVAILFTASRILWVTTCPRLLRGASMVHVPGDLADRSLGCTVPPRRRPDVNRDNLMIPCAPVEKEELDPSEVRFIGDPWRTINPWTCEGMRTKKSQPMRLEQGLDALDPANDL